MFAMHSNVDAVVLDGDDWREIDRELRSIAKRQRALDAEEAALLCVVVRQQIWRQFGCATMLEYLELIFGYGPKVGHERVRVAMGIEALPELREALANGEVSYSALRELTRVVTPNTQQAWLDAIRDKSVRQIEDLVRTHRKGDLPTDPGDPDLKPRRLQFEASKATEALLRQTRQVLANERGRFIEDDEFLAAMAAALLEGGVSDSDQGRAKYQVRVTTCDLCLQTYFEGGGRKIAVDDADAARAECDAQRIGADQRATQDIAPKTRRDVLHRDGGKCSVPRCRSARFIELHHIVPRTEGGSHDATNIASLCDGHHKSIHDGKMVLSGSAPNISVRFVHDPHVETPVRKTHVEARHIEPMLATAPPHVETDVRAGAIPHVETSMRATHVEARHIEPMLATAPPHVVTSMLVETDVRAVAIPHVVEPIASTDVSAAAIPHVETSTSTLVEIVEPNLPATVRPAIPHVETSMLVEIVEPTLPTDVRGPAIPHVETSMLVEIVEPNLPATVRPAIPHVETSTSTLVEIVEPNLPATIRPAIPHVETSTLVEIVEPNLPATIRPAISHVETSMLVEIVEPNLPATIRPAISHVETSMLVEIEPRLPTSVRAPTIPHVETSTTVTHVEPRIAARAHSVTSTNENACLGPSTYSIAVMRAEAKQALRQLGFPPATAAKCVDSAVASQPTPTTLEQLIRVALKYSR